MKNPMRLFLRKGIYHIEYSGGRRRSTRTGNKELARIIFKKAEKEWLKSGIPIQVVKEILGHAQLSTTMIYSHVLDDLMTTEMSKMRIE